MKLNPTRASGSFRPSRALLLLFLIAAGALSACADMVGPSAQAPAREIPRFSLLSPDCKGGFSQVECDAIRDALKFLRDHSDPDCKAMGDSATKRFDDGQFVRDDTTSAYGYMYPDKDTTWLGVDAFDPGELANTIAHEESHHHGYEDLGDGSGNDAYGLGDKCAQPKPSTGTSTGTGTTTGGTSTGGTSTGGTTTSPTPTTGTPTPTTGVNYPVPGTSTNPYTSTYGTYSTPTRA